jgi:glycosyltransferase involved in cell wall biosynthesis
VPAPRISVILAFLDEETFIEEAIETILAQDFRDFELLLVDDGSTDGSRAIAEFYASRFPDRIAVLAHPDNANRGTSASRNLGLAHARGELIVFTDADDAWRPNRLREQLAILDAHPEVGMVCGTANYWRSWNGGRDRLVPTGQILDAAVFPPDTTLSLYPLGSGAAPCDPMIRRGVIDEVGGWEEGFCWLYDDIAFHAKIYLRCGVWLSSNVWYDYRIHSGSGSAAVTRRQYRATRRRFLDWFEGYIAERDVEGSGAVHRALARARWRLDHPVVASVHRRAIGWLRKLGAIPAVSRRAAVGGG